MSHLERGNCLSNEPGFPHLPDFNCCKHSKDADEAHGSGACLLRYGILKAWRTVEQTCRNSPSQFRVEQSWPQKNSCICRELWSTASLVTKIPQKAGWLSSHDFTRWQIDTKASGTTMMKLWSYVSHTRNYQHKDHQSCQPGSFGFSDGGSMHTLWLSKQRLSQIHECQLGCVL